MSGEVQEYLTELSSVFKSVNPNKIRKIKDITEELTKLGIDDQIVVQANNIYRAMSRNNVRGIIIRANNRNRLLFYCLFYAYYELGLKEEPYTLARRFGFNLKIVKEAFKSFSSPTYGYRPPIIINSVSDLVPAMTKYFNIHPIYVQIIKEMASELDKSQIEIIKPQRWVMTLIYLCSQMCSSYQNISNNVDISSWCQDIGIKYSSIKGNLRAVDDNYILYNKFKQIVARNLTRN